MSGMTFNGIRKDYVTVLRKERPPWATVQRVIEQIPGRPGGYVSGTNMQPRQIKTTLLLESNNLTDLQKMKEDVAEWLVTDEPKELIFDDEPDRTYYAMVGEDMIHEEIIRVGIIQVTFLCPDPYKYGRKKIIPFTSDFQSFDNEGTTEAHPVFELQVKKPVTFAMIQKNDDEYMMIGQPADVDMQIVDEKTTILSERGETLDQWYTPSGNWSGSFTHTGDAIVIKSWGTGNGWHGPALMREIDPLEDYEIEMYVYVRTENPNQTFRITTNFYDEFNNELGMLRLWDKSLNNTRKVVEARIGPYIEDYKNYLISDRNYRLDNQRVWGGIIRVRKEGKRFTFYTSRITQAGRHATPLTIIYNDDKNEYAGLLKFIRINMSTWGTSGTPNEVRIENVRVKRIQKVNRDQTPNIAYFGDTITFDTKDADIFINGESRMDLKQFGMNFFKLDKGRNQFVVLPSDSFDIKCIYRPTYL